MYCSGVIQQGGGCGSCIHASSLSPIKVYTWQSKLICYHIICMSSSNTKSTCISRTLHLHAKKKQSFLQLAQYEWQSEPDVSQEPRLLENLLTVFRHFNENSGAVFIKLYITGENSVFQEWLIHIWWSGEYLGQQRCVCARTRARPTNNSSVGSLFVCPLVAIKA